MLAIQILSLLDVKSFSAFSSFPIYARQRTTLTTKSICDPYYQKKTSISILLYGTRYQVNGLCIVPSFTHMNILNIYGHHSAVLLKLGMIYT